MRISDWSSDVCSSDLWQHYNGDLVQTLLSASRLADVTILTRTMAAPKNAGAPLPIAADVAVHARAPVLAVPPELKSFDCCGRALIAWNGSYEAAHALRRSEEHTSELQSLMRISYAVFCLKKKTSKNNTFGSLCLQYYNQQ